LSLLRELELHAQAYRFALSTCEDIDHAAYAFIGCHSRSKGENWLAALRRCYPPLCSHLTWAQARLKVLSATSVVRQHVPIHWLVAIAIEWRRGLGGCHRHAAVVLLLWKFGLRPMVCLRLCGSDLHSHWLADGADDDTLSYIRVGSLRGTKAGRLQIVRARSSVRVAQFLIWLLATRTPPSAPLSDLSSTAQLQAMFTRRLSEARTPQRFTPHCPRAGWATTRFAQGQPFVSLREDGRWRSVTYLRIYLDVVTNQDSLKLAGIRVQVPYLRALACSVEEWISF